MQYRFMDSPIGRLLLAGDEDGLSLIGFPQGKGHREPEADWVENTAGFADVKQQLDEYFDGRRSDFDLPLCPDGTEFQLDVLRALQEIPYGETASYADIARRIGRPKAVRAVGAANGRNPLPIVIPCHRVIGSNGSMTGFGGGTDTKVALLELEARHAGFRLSPS
ncbi:MAG: methylated-DNA--[protein]-cysteine S-methyltransferase [Pseudomonadota bacterium]